MLREGDSQSQSNRSQLKLNITFLVLLRYLSEVEWNPEKSYEYIEKTKICIREVLEDFENKPEEIRYIRMADMMKERYEHLVIFERHIRLNTVIAQFSIFKIHHPPSFSYVVCKAC